MKTNVIVKRDFYQAKVSQRTKDGFFNATELMRYYNKTADRPKVMAEFWQTKNTQEFLEELANDLNINIGKNLYLKKDLYTTTRGVNGGTFMHPYLFIKFAMWLSPKFEVQVIKWVYDNLIEFRKQAGDHYKDMCRVISERYEEFYGKKADPLVFIKEANLVNEVAFGEMINGKRNEATEEELEKLNKIQIANISLIKAHIPATKRKEALKQLGNIF